MSRKLIPNLKEKTSDRATNVYLSLDSLVINESYRLVFRWLDGVTDSMDMSLSKLGKIVKGREAWGAAVYGIANTWT